MGTPIEEIARGPRPIEGVATSTVAFLGETERGPTTPRLVTSPGEYLLWFGGASDPAKFMPHAAGGFFENGGRRLYVCRVVGAGATTAARAFGDLRVEATGPGAWGRRVWVKVENSTAAPPGAAAVRVKVAYWDEEPPDGALFDPFAEPGRLPRPALPPEDHDGVVADDEASPDHFAKRVNGNSPLVKLSLGNGARTPPLVAEGEGRLDQDGADAPGPAGPDDFEGTGAGAQERRGLAALESDAFGEVALVYAPAASAEVAKRLVAHCERHGFRFAVLDSAPGVEDAAGLDPRATIGETRHAAFYHPWILVPDPQTGTGREAPPGGHVLGVYARTDADRGVFKAPVDELRGVLGLESDVGRDAQEALAARGVNAIRRFPGRVIRVWGARTLSADPLWKHVPVQRLFMFLERSIQEGTQWVAFESNDERLWARVKDTIRLFLRAQWRAGALAGQTDDEAFFVACDRSTMTQDDIQNGRLVCEIGVALVRPAEFVILRIFQDTAEARR